MTYKILHFKTLTSTNDKARELLKNGKRSFAVAAEVQTNGRGRFGRKWHSSKEGLWFSVALKLKSAESLKYLTFLAAIAAVRTIRKAAKIKAMLKWPNDIYYDGRKLCGILAEGIFGKEDFAAIGIGLNANQKKFPKEIANIAASLKKITNKNYNKKYLLKNILDEFEKLQGLYENKNFGGIVTEWKKYSDNIGKKAKVISRQREYYGMIFDVNKDCSLMLKLNNGKIVKIAEGDLKIY